MKTGVMKSVMFLSGLCICGNFLAYDIRLYFEDRNFSLIALLHSLTLESLFICHFWLGL